MSRTTKGFNIVHKEGSILTSDKNLPIIHAVSHDGKFGTGLAKQLDDKFNIREEFLVMKIEAVLVWLKYSGVLGKL